MLHVSFDGAILMKDSEECVDQEDYWDSKKQTDKKLLEAMNKEITVAYGTDLG